VNRAFALLLLAQGCQSTAPTTTPQSKDGGPGDGGAESSEAADALRDAFIAKGLAADAKLEDATSALSFLEVVAPHLEPLHRDCEAGKRLACWLWDDVVDRAVGATRRVGDPARELFARHCQGGKSVGCAIAAESFDHPAGVGGNPVRAVAEMMPACRAGWTGVCVRAATIRYGSGLEMEALGEEEAIATFERGCKAGFIEGCHMVAYRTGAYDPANVLGSPQHHAEAHACELGRLASCMSLITMLTPPAPFGCDRCDPASMDANKWLDVDGQFEERCIDCYIVACRAKNCCAGCANNHSCCADEGKGPAIYPATAPPVSRAEADRALAAVHSPVAAARALWDAGCKHGHPQMCIAGRLDARLRALLAKVDALSDKK
jgi:hypothetical protein